MTVNLIDLAKGLFTGDVISKASTQLNESEGGIRKAVEALVPTVLAGLFLKGQSSGGSGLGNLLGGAKELLGGSDPGAMLGNVLGNTGTAPAQDSWISKGYAWLQSLLGDKTNAVTDMVANYAGIKTSSANTLLGAATPAVLGLTANQAGPGDSNIWSYLTTQKNHIFDQLPSGFNIAGLLGLGGMGAASMSQATSNAASYADSSRKKGGGWMWILLLVLAALALWYFLGQKGCNKGAEGVPVEDTAMTAPMNDTAVAAAPVTTRESMMVQLPNGTELNAYKGGIEDRLVTFLKTDYVALGPDSLKKIWFDFDNLNFETGSAVITKESQAQIDNLAAILKAFPKARLKIGGYTDKTGNEQANVKLSGERASAVKKALDAAGVGAQIDGAEGYGSKFAQYASDAPETDRVKDRHVSVSVRG